MPEPSETPLPDRPRVLGRRTIHGGRKFDLDAICFTTRQGQPIEREVIRHPGSVIVLPLLDDGRILFIRNYRVSLDDFVLELPAGTRGPEEPPEGCAARELIEETGMAAGTLTPMVAFLPAPGLADELMHAFIATDLKTTRSGPEEDEWMTNHPLSARDALELVDRGEIRDAKSMLVLLVALRRGLLPRAM